MDTRDDTLPTPPPGPGDELSPDAAGAPDGTAGPGDGPFPSVDPVEPGAPSRRERRSHYLKLGLVIVAGLLLLALLAALFVPLPYYLIEPGSARATEPLVEVGAGGPSYPPEEGNIYFTTVSTRPARGLTALMGWLDDDVQVVDEDVILGDNTPEENRRVNLQMMDNSVDVAAEVAWEHLGFDVESGTGATILGVAPDLPVNDVVRPGDVIVAVDGHPTETSDDVVDRIQRHEPGDEVSLELQNDPSAIQVEGDEDRGEGEDEGPAPTTSVPNGEPTDHSDLPTRTERVRLGARPDDASKPLLGVQLGTRDQVIDLPYPVAIDTGQVGGPSAGLAFTLAVLDVLTPGEITGGRQVAVTGTIDGLGNVGPIGGIGQKAAAVREAGADVFIVPASEADQARARAGDVQVIGVETLDDALRALDELGGNALDLQAPEVDQPADA